MAVCYACVAAGVSTVVVYETEDAYAAHLAECPNRPVRHLLPALAALEMRAERLELFSQSLEKRFVALDNNLKEIAERLDMIAGDVAALALRLGLPPEGNT